MSYGPKKPKKPDNIIACPVCRTDLVKDEWDPQELLHENEGILAREDGKADKLVRTKSLEDLQRKMKDLWECQKAKQCEKTQATGIIQNRWLNETLHAVFLFWRENSNWYFIKIELFDKNLTLTPVWYF